MEHAYVSIAEIERLNFSSCEGCQHSCCSGTRFPFAPLILEDFEEVYRHFPIVFANMLDEWRALILFSDVNGVCRYHKEGVCSIYEERPPACRLYPVSPFYEDIVIDTSCHAVTAETGTFLASKGEINDDFYHKRLEGFEPKRRATQHYLQQLDDAFEAVSAIGGITVYRYVGSVDDVFMRMHRESCRMFGDVIA